MTVDGPMNKKFTKQIENLKLLTKRKNEQNKSNSSSSRLIGDTVTDLSSVSLCQFAGVDIHGFTNETGGGDNGCSSGLLKINDSYFKIEVSDNSELSKEEETNQLEEYFKMPGYKKGKLCICLINSRYSVLTRVARSLGYRIVKETQLWNIFWADGVPGVEVYKDMKRFQKINHFPGMQEICRKDLLARNLNRMSKLFEEDYDIYPKTFVFPADLGEAISYSKSNRSKTFILKPDQGAQGRGIWMTKNLKVICPTDRMICQVYINKPLLLDGYKFDLRVYTLITSVDPLRIFVYNEGLARFATSKYKEPTLHNTSNVYMHLTNYAVNKHSHTFCKDEEDGSKRKLSTINRILEQEGYDVEALWANIDDVIVKTILSSLPVLKHNYHACFPHHDLIQACFEILGFDILIDRNLKPYVLEVNHSPSFHCDEAIDKEVKEALVKDTLNLLNVALIDKRKVINEDRKRVKCRLLKKKNEPINENIPPKTDEHPSQSLLGQQIAWEETHSGGFRRVMPPCHNINKYFQYFVAKNQASIFSETANSKRREEAAKQIRNSLIEKQKQQQIIVKTNTSKEVDVKNKNYKLSAKDRKSMEKRRLESLHFQEKWLPNFISENEERSRVDELERRDKVIRDEGLFEILYEAFYKFKNLSDSDVRRYNHLFNFLKEGNTLLKTDKKQLQISNTHEICK